MNCKDCSKKKRGCQAHSFEYGFNDYTLTLIKEMSCFEPKDADVLLEESVKELKIRLPRLNQMDTVMDINYICFVTKVTHNKVLTIRSDRHHNIGICITDEVGEAIKKIQIALKFMKELE